MESIHDPTPARQNRRDDRPQVIKAAFCAASGFGGTAVTMLTITSDAPALGATTRFALTLVAAVFALTMFLAASYVWPRR